MNPNSIRLLTATAALCWASLAQALLTCAPPTSAGFTTAYASAGVVPNVTQTSVDVTCTRTNAGDPTVVYLRANNSNRCGGGGNTEAIFGGSCISYEVYKTSTCTGIWTNNGAGAIPVTFSTVGTQTVPVPVWGCITLAGQAPAAGAGTYLDNPVTMTVRTTNGNGAILSSGTFSASITYPATCTITSIENVAFGTYVAFRNTALVSPNANIVLSCTFRLPYTMALDATTGVLNNGLYYSLALSTASSRGTGPGQTHTVTGTMPANQAGTCATGSCVATPQTRTLTITY